MIKKILALIGIGSVSAALINAPYYKPYRDESLNVIYNLLFCDDLELFRKNYHGDSQEPWKTLFAAKVSRESLQGIIDNKECDSRVKVLACRLLASLHVPVEKTVFYGVIMEVPLENGLDTLAVFKDKSIRYINQSEKISVIEPNMEIFDQQIMTVLQHAELIVKKIGPWDKDRLSPPKPGNIRMTFLCSDGLYFGEGSMSAMQGDPMAASLINSVIELLKKITEKQGG